MEEKSNAAPVKSAKSGMGCGTMIAFLIVLLVLIAIGSNAAIGYYLSHCGEKDLFDCLTNTLEDPVPEGAVTATGSYTYEGHSVTITAYIPLEGGSVTGTISGTCDGTLKGQFAGQNNGAISGTIVGGCSPFVVNVPASAEFNGTVNKDAKNVPIGFTGKGAGLTHTGSMTLAY